MNEELKEAYKTIDSVMEEMCVMEQLALDDMCFLLERENEKFKSKVIKEIISVLKLWNKIPVDEIKAKVEAIKSQKI